MEQVAKGLFALAAAVSEFTRVYYTVNMPEEAEQEETPTYLDGTRK